ncbi:MAG: threonylcarbamoyl-AMP synthase [Candidatus Sungiibacteriota bacterium]|uniref:L-threonylcarbamoyladenylate synthase n=1 Tax=Candidatus Sungiibacteriota bacterium TaxID=2750080 RepID=A0A7T5RIV5_9BACT|nr:MAG: threonylcarbamoyl-AMP synthase [Candidatus Sungbacteria bacterium]
MSEKNFRKVLSLTEKILLSGGVLIGPTDTVYGIFGDATKSEVIKKMFAMKKRPEEKAFPIFVKDVAAARKYVYISDAKTKFLEKVWPGPVTAVFHHKEKLPKILTKEFDTLGIRIPSHPFLLELLSRLDFPLAQTSANISGKPPAKNTSTIKRYFEKEKVKPDLVVDGGELSGRPSAVVDFSGTGPILLRSGLVDKRELDRILGIMK